MVSASGDPHESEPSRLSTMSFVDPQHDPGRTHVTVTASQPRPLPRGLRRLVAADPRGRSHP